MTGHFNLWPYEIVKCPTYAHFRILPEEEGHPDTFCLLFYECCEFGHSSFTLFFTYFIVYDGM